MPLHRVVAIGGGFAGLAVASGLGRAPVDVTVIEDGIEIRRRVLGRSRPRSASPTTRRGAPG